MEENDKPLTQTELDSYRELFDEYPCYINMTRELQKNVNIQVRRAIERKRGRLTGIDIWGIDTEANPDICI